MSSTRMSCAAWNLAALIVDIVARGLFHLTQPLHIGSRPEYALKKQQLPLIAQLEMLLFAKCDVISTWNGKARVQLSVQYRFMLIPNGPRVSLSPALIFLAL